MTVQTGNCLRFVRWVAKQFKMKAEDMLFDVPGKRPEAESGRLEEKLHTVHILHRLPAGGWKVENLSSPPPIAGYLLNLFCLDAARHVRVYVAGEQADSIDPKNLRKAIQDSRYLSPPPPDGRI